MLVLLRVKWHSIQKKYHTFGNVLVVAVVVVVVVDVVDVVDVDAEKVRNDKSLLQIIYSREKRYEVRSNNVTTAY